MTNETPALELNSYPIIGGVSIGLQAYRYDSCCSPDKCGRWTYHFSVDLLIRGFEIEWTPSSGEQR